MARRAAGGLARQPCAARRRGARRRRETRRPRAKPRRTRWTRLARLLPELLGGSADLTGSNNTHGQGLAAHHRATTPDGNYLYYGVREFGMAAIMNGIALHGGFIPYGGTFLVFSDYARNAVRMAALMRHAQRSSCSPTTRSVSARTARRTSRSSTSRALRLIPNLAVWRPCDAVETGVAWRAAHRAPRRADRAAADAPGAAARRRATPAQLDGDSPRRLRAARLRRRRPTCILIATGSEVGARRGRRRASCGRGRPRCAWCRCPAPSVFDAQDAAYRDAVLPPAVTRAGRDRGGRHRRLVALRRRATARVIGIDRLSASRRRPRTCSSTSASRVDGAVVRHVGADVACSEATGPIVKENRQWPSRLASTATAASAATSCAPSTRRSAPARSRSSRSTIWATPRPTRT